MSDEVLDDVMLKGNCKGKADAIVNCQCSIETAPKRCEQAEHCMFYSYYKCSKQSTGIVIAEMRRRKDFCLGEDAGAKVFLLFKRKGVCFI